MENVCSFKSWPSFRDIGPNHPDSVAGSGKSILWFALPLFVLLVSLSSPIQFLDHTRYHDPMRLWEGLGGLFLF